MFSLICAWINAWVNNREAGDLRRHRTHYGVIVMKQDIHALMSTMLHVTSFSDIVPMLVHFTNIKWKHFPRYWPFVRGIHRSPVKSPHKGQWGGALVFSLICVWINGWVNNREAGDLGRHHAHYDTTVMQVSLRCSTLPWVVAGLVTRIGAHVRRKWLITHSSTDHCLM